MATTPDYHFIGTYTRYSSWTARIELILSYFQIPHTKQFVPLEKAREVSSSGLVPLLKSNSLNIAIADSLAIAEFLAEDNQHLSLWPRDPALRALARSAAAEMHSGFSTLRNTFHTNFITHYVGEIPISEAARKEIARALAIWDSARRATVQRLKEIGEEERDKGFLFGEFSIADAFFWPVLWRFRSYNLPLDGATPEALKWIETMWNDPEIKKMIHWYYQQAEDPETHIAKYDGLFAEYGVKEEVFPEDWTFRAPEA
ncbi:glutathione S-transferase [Aspergillus granulosus]|uniref:Glutathione S-transferase n=1 Tax=Aspergillus granulosus TaxID=176169 RepID=A0ABR4H191_9EURO